MSFFKTIFTEKLAAMRAAAPRATLRMLHESNGFSLYLDEAAAARKVSQLGTLTDHAEDILEDSVPVLFVPLEQTIKFVEEVMAVHSVAFVDVALANRVNNARHTMYAYFPRQQAAPTWTKDCIRVADVDALRKRLVPAVWPYTDAEQTEFDEESRKAAPVEESDDFWS